MGGLSDTVDCRIAAILPSTRPSAVPVHRPCMSYNSQIQLEEGAIFFLLHIHGIWRDFTNTIYCRIVAILPSTRPSAVPVHRPCMSYNSQTQLEEGAIFFLLHIHGIWRDFTNTIYCRIAAILPSVRPSAVPVHRPCMSQSSKTYLEEGPRSIFLLLRIHGIWRYFTNTIYCRMSVNIALYTTNSCPRPPFLHVLQLTDIARGRSKINIPPVAYF
ncbi:hypothetical protein J6590_032090 [Homalodisca vitripennis]|nr:hypothetical protein J6590_032090 [Homalodisca vitripennis]